MALKLFRYTILCLGTDEIGPSGPSEVLFFSSTSEPTCRRMVRIRARQAPLIIAAIML